MFSSIRSLSISVSDLDRAIAFYTEKLGFELRVQFGPELCFLSAPGAAFDIYMEGGKNAPAPSETQCRCGFYLQSEEAASSLHRQLKTAGVDILGEPEVVADDTACFAIRDPDGNIIDIAARNA